MNISLPDEMQTFVEAEVAGGGFSSASEYLGLLVREAQARKAKVEIERKRAEFEALMIEGLESGPAVPMDADWWANLLGEVNAELEKQGVEGGLGVDTLEELKADQQAAQVS